MYLTKMSEGGKTNVTEIGGLEWDRVEHVCPTLMARGLDSSKLFYGAMFLLF
jgi:hypothetical protein